MVFDYQVEPEPAAILARVRSEAFDPERMLLLEEEPEKADARAPAEVPAADPQSLVRIAAYEPDAVRVEASLPRPGFLLLLDTYYPGWTATVNGRPTQIHRANYNFRAVSLPAGNSTVVFAFRPASFRIGLALSAASVLALAAAGWWSRKRMPRPMPRG